MATKYQCVRRAYYMGRAWIPYDVHWASDEEVEEASKHPEHPLNLHFVPDGQEFAPPALPGAPGAAKVLVDAAPGADGIWSPWITIPVDAMAIPGGSGTMTATVQMFLEGEDPVFVGTFTVAEGPRILLGGGNKFRIGVQQGGYSTGACTLMIKVNPTQH